MGHPAEGLQDLSMMATVALATIVYVHILDVYIVAILQLYKYIQVVALLRCSFIDSLNDHHVSSKAVIRHDW